MSVGSEGGLCTCSRSPPHGAHRWQSPNSDGPQHNCSPIQSGRRKLFTCRQIFLTSVGAARVEAGSSFGSERPARGGKWGPRVEDHPGYNRVDDTELHAYQARQVSDRTLHRFLASASHRSTRHSAMMGRPDSEAEASLHGSHTRIEHPSHYNLTDFDRECKQPVVHGRPSRSHRTSAPAPAPCAGTAAELRGGGGAAGRGGRGAADRGRG